MIIMITNDAARWSPDIAGPQTAYRLDRHLEKRACLWFHFTKVKCRPFLRTILQEHPATKHHCSEFCKVAENFLFTFDSVQGPRTEAIFTCEYISNLFSVFDYVYRKLYTVYAVSIHLSLFIECEIVQAAEGLLVLSAVEGI